MLKPLQGSGGSSVFFVSSDESPNLNQMIEAIGRDGYIVAQEVLPEADEGDVRMFVMNGEPLMAGGAPRRLPPGQHAPPTCAPTCGSAARPSRSRSPTRCSGSPRPCGRSSLADGMFLVGLDIVGDKLMEVNVFSPGGLGSCETLYKANFTDAVIDALEHKVDLRRHYGDTIANARLATL